MYFGPQKISVIVYANSGPQSSVRRLIVGHVRLDPKGKRMVHGPQGRCPVTVDVLVEQILRQRHSRSSAAKLSASTWCAIQTSFVIWSQIPFTEFVNARLRGHDRQALRGVCRR